MKTNTNNTKKAAIMIAASLIISASPLANVFAGEKAKNKIVAVTAEAAPGISTKYLGEKDEAVYIRIALSQPTDDRSYLRIYDISGELLYEEIVTEKNQAKVIKVLPSELSSLNIVYTTGTKETKKLVVINTLETRKYDISETAKL
jgi:hypothetical protein